MAAAAAALVVVVGCSVARDVYVFDVAGDVQDRDPLDDATYTVVLFWEDHNAASGGSCDRYDRVIDRATVDAVSVVELGGELETNECHNVEGFFLSAWRDDDGDGLFAGQWLEPCAAVGLDAVYAQEEAVELDVELGGCQAWSVGGELVPITCCQPN